MLYEGHHYKIEEGSITPTGKIEMWVADTRDIAIRNALYTHRLHNGRAYASPLGVITCPSCGSIAIVKAHIQPEKGDPHAP